jgi:dolichyl-phosphate beta-glucosyltransferase
MRTVIVIPCYNEERRLSGPRFLRFVQDDPQTELLFVNDGSRDGTNFVLERLQQQAGGRIHVIDLPDHSGKAEAVRTGMQAALKTGASCVGYWDADLATPLESIADFRQRLIDHPHVQLVIGSRLRLLGHHIEQPRWQSRLASLLAAAASMILRTRVQDPLCGAKLLRASTAADALLSQPFCSRWLFDVELLARLKQQAEINGESFLDVVFEEPLPVWREIDGSKRRTKDSLKALYELTAIAMTYPQKRFPAGQFPSLGEPITLPLPGVGHPSPASHDDRRAA